jgi:hypothetical protein
MDVQGVTFVQIELCRDVVVQRCIIIILMMTLMVPIFCIAAAISITTTIIITINFAGSPA